MCAMQYKDKEQKNAREENAELEELAHGSCGLSKAPSFPLQQEIKRPSHPPV